MVTVVVVVVAACSAELMLAVAVVVIAGLLSEVTCTVTVPLPGPVSVVFRPRAPVDRPGRMNSGIDCVGWPSRPIKLAVTGPLAPVMVAV